MKVIVIGLGKFGMALAIKLTDTGNEVVAVDIDPEKIDAIKDKVAHAVAFDAKNESAYDSLPLKNTDIVVIAMGDNDGVALVSTAIVKKLTNAKIVARAASPIEDTILNAMQVDQIIHPEKEFAERFSKTINLSGSLDNFEIDSDYLISEVVLPASMVGKTIDACRFREDYELNIVTILRNGERRDIFLRSYDKKEVVGMPSPDTELKEGDVLVVFGKNEHIEKFLQKIEDDDEG